MGKNNSLPRFFNSPTLFLVTLFSFCTLAIYVASTYLAFLPTLVEIPIDNVLINYGTSWKKKGSVGGGDTTISNLEGVMGQYGGRLSRDTWLRKKLESGEDTPPPPIFFITSSRSGGRQSPGVAFKREEQYASNIGGILALGYQVYLSVAAGGQKWELIEALVAAASPGQLRVHYCSNATRVSARTAGPDEILCLQESIESFFGGCLTLGELSTLVTPVPPCCPFPNTHVIRMSGRYLMAKYHMLHAIWKRGKEVDAFVKWGPMWSEPTIKAQQVYTFFMSFKVSSLLVWLMQMSSPTRNVSSLPPPPSPLQVPRIY